MGVHERIDLMCILIKLKSKHNNQGHGPLSHITVLILDGSGVVLGNISVIEGGDKFF